MNRIPASITASLCLAATATLVAPQLSADSTMQARIVGGSNMDISQAPATAALISNQTLASTGSFFQSQFCAGTVIGARWVLTAAHCLVNNGSVIPANDISILMGSTDLEAPVNQTVGVTRIIAHQQYNATSQANDIALLELEYDALVPPAIIDTQTITLNDDALIAGWGALNMGSETQQQLFPSTLQGAFVKMIPGNDCGTLFPVYAGEVDSSNLCAGVPEGGVDSCQGDSGGPLYRYESGATSATRVSGVVSWGYGCALADAPGVYTNVAAYANWITENSGITAQGQTQPVPPIVETQPVNEGIDETPQPPIATQLQDPVSNTSTGAATTLAAAGANGYFMLLSMGILALMRRNRSKKLLAGVAASLICSACSVSVAQSDKPNEHGHDRATESANATSLAHTRDLIGESRDAVMGAVSSIWQSESACNIIRTGAGNSRRAFFLETCAFANASGVTLCQATPDWVEYRFLENILVQVAFDFDALKDQQRYDTCISQQASNQDDNTTTNILTNQSVRTTVSDASAIDELHWTGKSSRNTVQ